MKKIYIKFGGGVPSGGGWSRPIEWLSQPTIANENVIWELMAVFPGDYNPLSVTTIVTSGSVTVELLADTDSAPFATYTTGLNNIFVKYSECTSDDLGGYKLCWVKIYPTTPSANFQNIEWGSHTTVGAFNSQALERLISIKSGAPSLALHNHGATNSVPSMLQNIEYFGLLGSSPITLGYMFFQTERLEQIIFHTPQVLNGYMYAMFQQTGLTNFPQGVTFRPTDITQLCQGGNLFEIKADLTNVTTGIYLTIYGSNVTRVNFTNMGGVTDTFLSNYNKSVKSAYLGGYTRSLPLNQWGLMGEEVFTELVDSIGNADGTQTITVTTAQYNSFGGLGSYVDDEIFNKGYTLLVV